ncbi:MAG: TonB-dependent receptor [Gammaproteobacteria bacterium]
MAVLSISLTTTALADHSAELETIIVLGNELNTAGVIKLDPRLPGSFAADAAALLRRTPGGNVAANGPVAGQLQYRGLTGIRLNTRIDGQAISPGGPNLMDAPLHYAPKSILDSLHLRRGIAPVSAGPGLGGGVEARLKSSRFADGPAFKLHGDVSLNSATVNEYAGTGGFIGLANDRHRGHILGNVEGGKAYDFDGGTVSGSDFGRWVGGAGYGFRSGGHQFELNYRHQETDPSGNPPLPLDTAFFNADFINAAYIGMLAGIEINARFNFSDIDHAMNNFTLRPLATGAPAIVTPATGRAYGYFFSGNRRLFDGQLELGLSGQRTSNSATVQRGFFIQVFNDARVRRDSVFAEWRGAVTQHLQLEAGARYDYVRSNADAVATSAPLMPVQALVAGFNAADRSRTEHNVDALLKLDYTINSQLVLSAGWGRKTRSPFWVERYAFLPIEVTAGLADGNNTIGNIELGAETANVFDIGFDWTGDNTYASLRGFYNRIDDFIQQTPFDDTPTTLEDGIDPATAILSPAAGAAFAGQFDGPGGIAPSGAVEIVSLLNGDATPLRFANVDAELYGIDAAFGAELSDNMLFDGIVTFVRGKRRDINDNLYRITPTRAILALTYARTNWRVSLEGVLVAEQNRVSESNGERRTGGYELLNVFAHWQPTEKIRITAGIENLTNVFYQDHLAGYNRVTGGDLPVFRSNPFASLDPASRLPGTGRGGFLELGYMF